MPTPDKRPLLAATLLFGLSAVAAAHEDDRKVLDRQPPYQGPGMVTGVPSVGVPEGLRNGVPGVEGGQIAATNPGKVFPADGVQLLSWMSLPELGGALGGMQSASNCWGYTSPSGREYALIGLSDGTAFVEVSNPGFPQLVEVIPGPSSQWRDVRTYQTYAYAVSEGGDGIQVIDISGIDAGAVTFIKNVSTGGSKKTHTLTINEDSGYLYRSGGASNGLRIYSLANPANPSYVNAWNSRYVHAATVISYTSGPYAGKEIAFCCGGLNNGFQDTGVDILDVTNKNNIQYLSHTSYSNRGYAHQAWPSDDRSLLYVNDELDEDGTIFTTTKILDITDLSNPFEASSFASSNKAIGHNLYVLGDQILEANYRSGLRVFDATDPLAPVESGHFDTWPANNKAEFNGLWHVYPYLPSGIVIGSDLEKGLFVWWLGDPLVAIDFPEGLPTSLDPTGEPVTAQIYETTPGDFVPGSAMLHYDDGSGWDSVAMSSLGGGLHTANFPANTCGRELDFYFTADSTNGISWTSPANAPNASYQATVATSITQVLEETMEPQPAWTVGAPDDTATAGVWIHKDPIGTTAQPENDHSSTGTKCWVTGNVVLGLTPAAADIDGGKTTLTTEVYDLSGFDTAVIGYWRWFSNHLSDVGSVPFEDVLVVEITDDGTNWVEVETVGPTGVEVAGGWFHHQFLVSDFVTPSATVQLRFVAADDNSESIVEAAIDDLELLDIGCEPTVVSYCTAGTSANGCVALMSSTGAPSASLSSGFTVDVTGVEGDKDGLMFFGTSGRQANTWGSGTSFQCVVPPVRRTGVQAGNGTVGTCEGQFTLDFNTWMSNHPAKAPTAGTVAQMQTWYRDPQNTSNQTTSLSDAVEFTVQP